MRRRYKKSQKLLIRILEKNENISKEQKKLLDKYYDLVKKQENQEFWIKATRYVAFAFIVVRLIYFCYINMTQ